MLFVKLLCCLLLRAVLCREGWFVYVDVALKQALHNHGTNLLQVLQAIRHEDISCTAISMTEEPDVKVSSLTSPCGTMDAVIIQAYKEQAQWTWIITSPSVFWIELRINKLELLFSGAQCTYGYVEFLNLLSAPSDVRFCGKRPQQTLYAAHRLTIVLNISKLIPELVLSLSYQFVSRQNFYFGHRISYVLFNDDSQFCCLSEDCFDEISPSCYLPIQGMPYHILWKSGIVKYNILYMAMFMYGMVNMLAIKGNSCDYIVYDGPGKLSPVVTDPSQIVSRLSRTIFHTQAYVELWGSWSCEGMNISLWEDFMQNMISLENIFYRPPVCSKVKLKRGDKRYRYRQEYHDYSKYESVTR